MKKLFGIIGFILFVLGCEGPQGPQGPSGGIDTIYVFQVDTLYISTSKMELLKAYFDQHDFPDSIETNIFRGYDMIYFYSEIKVEGYNYSDRQVKYEVYFSDKTPISIDWGEYDFQRWEVSSVFVSGNIVLSDSVALFLSDSVSVDIYTYENHADLQFKSLFIYGLKEE